MILSCRIYTRGTRLDYEYRPRDGRHILWNSGPGDYHQSHVAGEIINHLVPYRDTNTEVQELIAWLAQF